MLFFTTKFGKERPHFLWTYNLWTEQWQRCPVTPRRDTIDSSQQCAVAAVGSEIYMLCEQVISGWSKLRIPVLLKLKRSEHGSFEWSIIVIRGKKKIPSPRTGSCAWEHERKLWIFGGEGPFKHGFLNNYGKFSSNSGHVTNNQLLCYNPVTEVWENLHCAGSLPSPRAHASSAIMGDIVWLYGGFTNARHPHNDLHELNMSSLTWSQVKINMYLPRPPALASSSFTAATPSHLVLHSNHQDSNCTWVLDVETYTWRQHPVSDAHQWYHHTGLPSLNGDVIILGGICMAHPEFDSSEHRRTFHVTLAPKRLEQLAMKVIYENRLPWKKCLPNKLVHKIMAI